MPLRWSPFFGRAVERPTVMSPDSYLLNYMSSNSMAKITKTENDHMQRYE